MKAKLLAVALLMAAVPALAQAPAGAPAAPAAGGRGQQARPTNWWSGAGLENGPPRIVWAGQKSPETPYGPVNRPLWKIKDVIAMNKGKARWEKQVLLARDFDGRYIQMAPGDKTKCFFYADDRQWGWVYQGQLKVTIDGQEPKVITKGWVWNTAPRLSNCFENVGTEPVILFRITPSNQVPSYPESETPTDVRGYKYIKTRITSTGGYDSFNVPFFNVDEYGASDKTGGRFLYDGHTSSNLNLAPTIKELAPDTNWGHWHANMQEVWLDVFGSVCARISGAGVVHAEYGDLINANEERWHRATSCPNTGTRSIRMAITPRSKEGQVHYYQTTAKMGGE